MNARQKAKHYKKQLELMKPNVQKIYITENTLVHYRGFYKPNHNMSEPDEISKVVATHHIWNQLADVVKEHIQYDAEYDEYKLDVWVKR